MGFEEKKEFLYQSIADVQATIRAIDVKIGFMFVVLFLPLSVLDQVFDVGQSIYCSSQFLTLVGAVVVLLWLLSVLVLFKGASAISSPASHVLGGEKLHSNFYEAGLFSLGFWDGLFNFPVKSKKSLSQVVVDLPSDDDALLTELAFEKMKLVYVRDVKFYRLSKCILFSLLWLLGGIVVWFSHKLMGA